jgi:vacuolar protein sorting-associated protein 35
VKQIVISLIDRLAGFAAREAENESPDERRAQEEELSRRLAERIKLTRDKLSSQEYVTGSSSTGLPQERFLGASSTDNPTHTHKNTSDSADEKQQSIKMGNNDDTTLQPNRKFRGIPSDVPLFEIFWQQAVQLISVGACLFCSSLYIR